MEVAFMAVIGGLVSASAGLAIDSQRHKRRIRQMEARLVDDMACDLARAINAYDEIIEGWSEFGVMDQQSLANLHASFATFLHNRECLGVFDEIGLSKAMFHYHQNSIELLMSLEEKLGHLAEACLAHDEQRKLVIKTEIDGDLRGLELARDEALSLFQQLEQVRGPQAA